MTGSNQTAPVSHNQLTHLLFVLTMTIIIWFESESSININKLKPYKVIVYISGCNIQAEKKKHTNMIID